MTTAHCCPDRPIVRENQRWITADVLKAVGHSKAPCGLRPIYHSADGRIDTHFTEYHFPASGGFDSHCNSPSIVEQAVQDIAVAEHDVSPRHVGPSLDLHTAIPSPDWDNIEAGVQALSPMRAETTIQYRIFSWTYLVLAASDL